LNNTGIIILAAGASTRLGEPKQNLIFQGQSLLKHALSVAKESDCRQIIVITGASIIPNTVNLSDSAINYVQNPDWQKGIGSSISLGVSYLQREEPNINSVILMVCDQPYVTTSLLEQIITEKQKTNKPIIACSYQNTLGTPVLFDKIYFSDLCILKGDEGAKRIIYNNLDAVASIPFDLGSIDIDTLDDYERLLRKFE